MITVYIFIPFQKSVKCYRMNKIPRGFQILSLLSLLPLTMENTLQFEQLFDVVILKDAVTIL